MIRISQIKLNINHTKEDLEKSIIKTLKISPKDLINYIIVKQSIDARKKNDIKYIYSVDVSMGEDQKKVKNLKNDNVTIAQDNTYQFIVDGEEKLKSRPVIIGAGPAGLFCAFMLAKEGYMPLLIERGEEVYKRVNTVNHFWTSNELNPNSNVQFGEGGAGTFSDGKLNTLVKDQAGRNRKILEVFVEHGAPSDILYRHKPHIGTDQLRDVVKNMREDIIKMGGEVLFNTKVTDLLINDKIITGIEIESKNEDTNKISKKSIMCDTLIVAIGHSARDTFEMIYNRGLNISKKSFAIGVRIEHPQKLISQNQYGDNYTKLPPAEYKLTHQAKNGRSIYSFCMCPGGFVVNASSEIGRIATNGMSNYARDEKNANSAMIVSVTPEDFGEDTPLAGVEFQRRWESLAYKCGKGFIPVQLFGDLAQNKTSSTIGGITPNIKGTYTLSNLTECLPNFVTDTLVEGIYAFDKKIHGFANEEAILSGVETRTSSPIRILRDELFESNIKGIYPCGEGAGYAGGITSAAMDGIKVAEAIAHKYKP